MPVVATIAELVRDSILFDPLRNQYQRLLCKGKWAIREARKEYYRQFIRQGSLVFDVGAHEGIYTRDFLSLVATVVCIEPLPLLVRKLRCIRPREKVHVEPVAAGATSTTLVMYASKLDTVGTLSQDWIASMREGRFHDYQWQPAETVPVVPLDLLIQKYGLPDFIKIDVEGFELNVLRGLSTLPKALSFEFNPEFLKGTEECIAQFPPAARFNWTLGEPSLPLLSSQWLDAKAMSGMVRSEVFRGYKLNGDIVVQT